MAVPKLTPKPVAEVALPPASDDHRCRPAPVPPDAHADRSGTARGLGGQKIAALTVAAVGVAAAGVGTYFGLLSLSERNDAAGQAASAGCNAQSVCSGPNASHVVDAGNQVGIGPGMIQLSGAW